MLTSSVLDYQFGKNNTYLVSGTYGPSSMALLDMMEKQGVKPIVCFVNYHTNQEIEMAQTSLQNYCQAHDLTLAICDANLSSQEGKDDNFEAWKRKTRYEFFLKTYQKYHAAAIFIAHQQDDLLEIYLETKANGIRNAKYGMSKISTYMGMIVVRPLLNFTKEDLRNYCKTLNVPSSDDLDEFPEDTSKDPIRAQVEKLNEVERGQLLDEMKRQNADKINFINDISTDIQQQNELDIRTIIALNHDEFTATLVDFVNKKSPIHITITPEIADAVRQMCLNPLPNMSFHLQDSVYVVKEYDVISLDIDGLDMPYSYTLEKPGKLSCETFDLDFSMGAPDRNIKPEDYPLTIRSVLPQDNYIFGSYLVSVRRMLVAAGISKRLLRVWPVFLNKDGKVIYVPRYKKGFSEYHSSILNIHVKSEEK